MENSNISAKEYLNQAFRIDERIETKIKQIQALRNLAEKATTTLSHIPRGTPNPHRMEYIIEKMVDLESEINADLTNLISLKQKITKVIKRVPDTELQTLLEMRYLCFGKWEEIAVSLHYDIRHIHRLHGRALNEVDLIRRSCH